MKNTHSRQTLKIMLVNPNIVMDIASFSKSIEPYPILAIVTTGVKDMKIIDSGIEVDMKKYENAK